MPSMEDITSVTVVMNHNAVNDRHAKGEWVFFDVEYLRYQEYPQPAFRIPKDLWEGMGSPDKITLEFHPGDTLNDTGDSWRYMTVRA